MIKRFCDCCGEEIIEGKNGVPGLRLTTKLPSKIKEGHTLMVEVKTGKHHTWNDGDFCKYCIIDAVNSVDDRKDEKICRTDTFSYIEATPKG